MPARIGDAIRLARGRAGLSQESLADLAGLNAHHLGDIERSEAVPSVGTLERVAKALNLRLSELIRESEELDK